MIFSFRDCLIYYQTDFASCLNGEQGSPLLYINSFADCIYSVLSKLLFRYLRADDIRPYKNCSFKELLFNAKTCLIAL